MELQIGECRLLQQRALLDFNRTFELTHKVIRKQVQETVMFRHVDRQVSKKPGIVLFL